MTYWVGAAIEAAMFRMAVLAFLAGMAVLGGGWALWHFVLSHLTLGWAS